MFSALSLERRSQPRTAASCGTISLATQLTSLARLACARDRERFRAAMRVRCPGEQFPYAVPAEITRFTIQAGDAEGHAADASAHIAGPDPRGVPRRRRWARVARDLAARSGTSPPNPAAR